MIQPTPISVEYQVRIELKVGDSRPRVTVVSPRLQDRNGEAPPHLYPGEELCLFYPGEWNDSKLLGEYVVPWLSLWLYYYEVWLFTGEWEGKGIHLDKPERKQHVADKEQPNVQDSID
jgi:hypothetical protein